MFKFFFKKNFCDGWDNFFFIILSNLIPLAVLVGSYFAVNFTASFNQYLPNLTFIVCSGIFMTIVFAWGANAAKLADFETPTFLNFFSSFKFVWKIGFVFGALLSAALIVLRVAILYYLSMYLKGGGYFGLILTAVLCWFTVICLIALQWFIPLYFLQEDNGFGKCLKKSFIIFFDNAGFSTAVFLHNVFLLLFSCVTIGLIPGVNGILLSCMNALRLRLYKYDWIEKMSENDADFINNRDKREEIPWDELLADGKESLGPRKLGSFLFPWK